MIDTTNRTKDANKKRKFWLYLAVSSVFIVTALCVGVGFMGLDSSITTLIILLLLVALLVLVLWIKPRAMYHGMQYRYFTLLDKSVGLISVKETFDASWLNRLVNLKFQFTHKSDQFDVLYRISDSVEKRLLSKSRILEIITIVKDNEIDFYSDLIEAEYKKLWVEHEAKQKISKQVILQFKKYEKFTEEAKEELDQIIAFREGKNFLVTINCGYVANEQKLYFLHALNYYPNLYYKYGCELIFAITT